MEKSQKFKLKELAHNTIAAELDIEELKDWRFHESEFKEKRGVFVTLEIEGNLRGCIGNIEPVYPLWEAVQRNAHEAAFGDPRFPSLTVDEFEDIDIEISVLTLPEKSTVDKIRPGMDGVVIQQGVYKATYLPQVWEDIPDKEQFLSSLCMKAGLGPDTWKNEEIEVFTYQVEKF
ncbi:AmmeMemoRadiSam system protein A [Patescibacteria group bacterium]